MNVKDARRIDVAETAKMVRAALKAEFPGVKFSVRSKRYAGGASVRASYVDGPRETDVRAICQLYQGATFDGMTDLKGYRDSVLTTDDGAEVVRFGADWVHADRRLSDEWRAELRDEIEAFIGRAVTDIEPLQVSARDGELAHDETAHWNIGNLIYQLAHGRKRGES